MVEEKKIEERVEERVEDRVEELIREGKEILDREAKMGTFGSWTPKCLSTEQMTAIYKPWRKEFDAVVEALKIKGIVITPELTAESENKILFYAKEKGYYKIKEYWQQHIDELTKALIR